MDKRFELSGKEASGRPLIHLVEPGSRYGAGDTGGLSKTASGEHLPEVLELLEAIQPQPGRVYLVNSALGAGEFVGFNLRGDWFTERGLTHVPEGWHGIPAWDIDARRQAAARTEHVPRWGNMAWGYPTFYNAHRFRHHQNKDPNRAYGYILGAFWDHRMHRVILVSELIESMCHKLGAFDLYDRIRRGEFPDTSMGAKVPYDICSICGHVAKTPANYCKHVRKNAQSPYGMRSILPDGRMCGVYNTYPRFFDDSFVFIGAERSAKMMANVTGMVTGSRTYGDRIYTPIPRHAAKAASYGPGSRDLSTTLGGPGPMPVSEMADQEQQLARAMHRTAQPPTRRPGIGEQISAALSVVPVASEKERAALAHASEAAKRKAALKDGTLTDAELQIWTDKELQRLKNEGVDPVQLDRMRALLQRHMAKAYGTKEATAKWAEHLKRIPVATSQQALLRHHAKQMPPLPTDVLDHIKADLQRRLRAAAALGVVLTPAEFQYCHLPGDVAAACHRRNIQFAPIPVDTTRHPRWLPGSPSVGAQTELASRLGDLLLRRSFAPKLVVIRIESGPGAPAARSLPPQFVDGQEDLNKIAQLYNEYRAGLVAQPLDWSYVPAPPVSATMDARSKLGSAAHAMSTLLLHLAYWPDSHIG